MRLVEWKQGDQKRWSYIRDEDPDDQAPSGIPVSVPDLDSLDWESMKNEMRQALESQGLLTWHDVERSTVGLSAALTIVKRHLVRLYRSGN